MVYKYLMLIIIIVNYSGIAAQVKVVNNVTVQYVTNETSTIVENDISNSTSTQAPPWCNAINSLPKWFWIVVGITSGLILCFLCCCPKTLGAILCFPLCYALDIILFPVRCCLNCLGFEVVGPRANSFVACFQSICYGGHTPSGSVFSTLQSYSMR